MQKTLSYQQSYYNEYCIALACLVPLLSFFFVQVYGGHLQLDPYFSATIAKATCIFIILCARQWNTEFIRRDPSRLYQKHMLLVIFVSRLSNL